MQHVQRRGCPRKQRRHPLLCADLLPEARPAPSMVVEDIALRWPSNLLQEPFDYPPVPLSFATLKDRLWPGRGWKRYLGDTPRPPPLHFAQGRLRGFAPLDFHFSATCWYPNRFLTPRQLDCLKRRQHLFVDTILGGSIMEGIALGLQEALTR